jgi:hypothetical protein
MKDGTQRVVELTYEGYRRGSYRWLVTTTADITEIYGLHIEVLPARTSVDLRIIVE